MKKQLGKLRGMIEACEHEAEHLSWRLLARGGIFMLKHMGPVSVTMLRTTHGRYLGAVFMYMRSHHRPYSCKIPAAIIRARC